MSHVSPTFEFQTTQGLIFFSTHYHYIVTSYILSTYYEIHRYIPPMQAVIVPSLSLLKNRVPSQNTLQLRVMNSSHFNTRNNILTPILLFTKHNKVH